MSADSSPISAELSAIMVNKEYFDEKVFSTVFQPTKCPATDDTRLHSSVDLRHWWKIIRRTSAPTAFDWLMLETLIQQETIDQGEFNGLFVARIKLRLKVMASFQMIFEKTPGEGGEIDRLG